MNEDHVPMAVQRLLFISLLFTIEELKNSLFYIFY